MDVDGGGGATEDRGIRVKYRVRIQSVPVWFLLEMKPPGCGEDSSIPSFKATRVSSYAASFRVM